MKVENIPEGPTSIIIVNTRRSPDEYKTTNDLSQDNNHTVQESDDISVNYVDGSRSASATPGDLDGGPTASIHKTGTVVDSEMLEAMKLLLAFKKNTEHEDKAKKEEQEAAIRKMQLRDKKREADMNRMLERLEAQDDMLRRMFGKLEAQDTLLKDYKRTMEDQQEQLDTERYERQREMRDEKFSRNFEQLRMNGELVRVNGELVRVNKELGKVKEELAEEKDRQDGYDRLAGRVIPINLRILLDESRKKIAELLDVNLDDITTSKSDDILKAVQTTLANPTQLQSDLSKQFSRHPLSKQTYRFLWTSNPVRLAGNAAAHTASQNEIYEAVKKSEEVFGKSEQSHLKDLFELLFDCQFY